MKRSVAGDAKGRFCGKNLPAHSDGWHRIFFDHHKLPILVSRTRGYQETLLADEIAAVKMQRPIVVCYLTPLAKTVLDLWSLEPSCSDGRIGLLFLDALADDEDAIRSKNSPEAFRRLEEMANELRRLADDPNRNQQ